MKLCVSFEINECSQIKKVRNYIGNNKINRILLIVAT